MNVDKIIEKIKLDAEADAGKILAEAKDKAALSAAAIEAETERKIADIQKNALRESEEAYRRKGLIAELEGRKIALQKKREVLDEAFVQAHGEIAKLQGEQWEALITRIVLESADTGAEKLRVPAADAPKYQAGLLKKLNEALVKSGKLGSLTLDATPAPFSHGVALIGELSEVNGSFDALLQAAREDCEKEIASILFGAEVR